MEEIFSKHIFQEAMRHRNAPNQLALPSTKRLAIEYRENDRNNYYEEKIKGCEKIEVVKAEENFNQVTTDKNHSINDNNNNDSACATQLSECECSNEITNDQNNDMKSLKNPLVINCINSRIRNKYSESNVHIIHDPLGNYERQRKLQKEKPLRQTLSDSTDKYSNSRYISSSETLTSSDSSAKDRLTSSSSYSQISYLLSPDALTPEEEICDFAKSTSCLDHPSTRRKISPVSLKINRDSERNTWFTRRKSVRNAMRRSWSKLYRSFSHLVLEEPDLGPLPPGVLDGIREMLLDVFRNSNFPNESVYKFHCKLKDIESRGHKYSLHQLWRDEVLPQGMQVLAVSVASPRDQNKLSALIQIWKNLYKQQIFILQTLLCPLEDLDIREDIFKSFRDIVFPYIELDDIYRLGKQNHKTLKQMVLLLTKYGPCSKCWNKNINKSYKYSNNNEIIWDVAKNVLENDFKKGGIDREEIIDFLHYHHQSSYSTTDNSRSSTSDYSVTSPLSFDLPSPDEGLWI